MFLQHALKSLEVTGIISERVSKTARKTVGVHVLYSRER